MDPVTAFCAPRIFDGAEFHQDAALIVAEGRVQGVGAVPGGAHIVSLQGLLVPGFVDLQVNGGGGVMLGDAGDTIPLICAAHLRLGTTGLMPTLISDTPDTTARVIAAALAARQTTPGFLGLHLEGPHLARAGAHDPARLRDMTESDLALILRAKAGLDRLIVTLAPERATPDQIATLARAGVTVSLGHTDCDYATARAAFAAGASMVTHLFNAMSPLTSRAPGLVGAALESGVSVGIIPDGVHVAAPAFRVALAARPSGVFAVTDAMAVAGTALPGFDLHGRRIARHEGRLTLPDGTLAGADLSLPAALAWMQDAGIAQARALAMITSEPAHALGLVDRGHLRPGARADLVHLVEGQVAGVWLGGLQV
jgi:N-acetylglucosamine-6-phosphate deacetylase